MSYYKRVDKFGNPSRDGEYILFGEYPQTLKDSSVEIVNPNEQEKNGYYLGNDGMTYFKTPSRIAVCRGEPRYNPRRKLRRLQFPFGSRYYFKVEPIKWRILEEKDGKAMLLSEHILDSRAYKYKGTNDDPISSNYKNSDIRTWLNEKFLEEAFTEEQKARILETEVDNSARSTGREQNKFACDNTFDKVFLPSYMEMLNKSYGFNENPLEPDANRVKKATDFAIASGVREDNGANYFGDGEDWCLRSPDSEDSIRSVGDDGNMGFSSGVIVRYDFAIVPALWISLDNSII